MFIYSSAFFIFFLQESCHISNLHSFPTRRSSDLKLDFAGIEQEIMNLALKARDNKLSLDDLQGGTFTITNGGIFGSMLSTPILNAPQVGILGMRSEEHTSELQSRGHLVCRLLLEKKNQIRI